MCPWVFSEATTVIEIHVEIYESETLFTEVMLRQIKCLLKTRWMIIDNKFNKFATIPKYPNRSLQNIVILPLLNAGKPAKKDRNVPLVKNISCQINNICDETHYLWKIELNRDKHTLNVFWRLTALLNSVENIGAIKIWNNRISSDRRTRCFKMYLKWPAKLN